MTTTERALAAVRSLIRGTHLAGADDLPELVRDAVRQLGALDSLLYLVDYDQVLLVPMRAACDPALPPVPVEGTLPGRTFIDIVTHLGSSEGRQMLWLPVVDGTDRIGVLQVEFAEDAEVDAALREACLDIASLTAEIVLTRSLYGDAVERVRRREDMTIPAELQWRLLPPLTFVSPRVAVAGILAPTAEVAGDSFDYALNGDTLHVAIIDAMGHGLEAGLLSAVAVASLRNARRAGLELGETVAVIDESVSSQFGPGTFVTAVIGELDVRSGWWTWTTCGHPPALLVRDGKVVKELDGSVGPPLGLSYHTEHPEIGQERLQPGDRLLLYTDGVTEARDAEGAFFGTERLVEILCRQTAARRPAAETLRRLNRAILAHQVGVLQDDATTLLVEWQTDEQQRGLP